MTCRSKRSCANCQFLIQEHEGNNFKELFKCRVSDSGNTVCDTYNELSNNWCAFWDERKIKQLDGFGEDYGR